MSQLRLLMVLSLAAGLNEPAAEQATAVQADAAQSERHQLDIRYAETNLELHRIEFQRAFDINKQVPGTFTNSALEAMRQGVVVADEQLNRLKKDEGGLPLYLLSAEANARTAAAAYKRALAVNDQSPGVLPPMELERLRLTADLAELNLQKAKSVDPHSTPEFLQWQVDQLREEVYRLRNQVAQLSRLN